MSEAIEKDIFASGVSPAGETVRCFIDTARLHRAVVDQLAPRVGIHRAQTRILTYLYASGDLPVNQSALAKHLNVTPAAVTTAVKKAEKAGLIKRLPSPEDSRNNLLQITPTGIEKVVAAGQLFRSIDERALRGFSSEELQRFSSFLLRMQNNLNTITEPNSDIPTDK